MNYTAQEFKPTPQVCILEILGGDLIAGEVEIEGAWVRVRVPTTVTEDGEYVPQFLRYFPLARVHSMTPVGPGEATRVMAILQCRIQPPSLMWLERTDNPPPPGSTAEFPF